MMVNLLDENEYNVITVCPAAELSPVTPHKTASPRTATIIVDDTGTVIFAEGELLTAVGLGRPAMVGDPLHAVFFDGENCSPRPSEARVQASVREWQMKGPDDEHWHVRSIPWPHRGCNSTVITIVEDLSSPVLSERLVALQQQYRNVIEMSDDGIAVLQKGRTVFINTRLLAMSGFSEQEFMAMSFSDLVFDDDRAMVRGHYLARISGLPAPERYRFRFTSRDAVIKWVEVKVTAITWGEEPATLNMLRDCTAIIERDEALREQEVSLVSQFQAFPLPTFTVRRQADVFLIVNYNIAAMPHADSQTDSFHGRDFSSIDQYHPEIQDSLVACIEGRRFMYCEASRLLEEGTTRVLAYWFSFVPPDCAMVVIDDISVRKRMERVIMDSEQRYRMIFEHAPAGIAIVSPTGRILEASRSTISGAGYSIVELRDMNIHNLCRDPRQFDQIMALLLDDAYVLDQPLDLVGKGGRLVNTSATVTRFDVIEGGNYLLILNDVTHLRDMELKLLKVKIFENLMAMLSTEFISLTFDRIDAGISNALFIVGKFLKADSVFIAQLDDAFIGITSFHEWHSDDPQASERVNRSPVPQRFFGMLHRLKTGETRFVRSIEDIDETDHNYRTDFASSGITLAIFVPLMSDERLIGVMGLTYYHDADAWIDDTIPALEITGRIFVSILERKRTEEALNRFHHIVDATRDHMLFLDTEGRIITSNESFCNYLGASREEVCGRTMIDLIPGGDFGRTIRSGLARALSGDKVHLETVADFPGRPNRYLEVAMVSFRERDQTTGVILDMRDCTDRVATEKELLNVSENERLQIAMDLHDTISHDLLGISVKCRIMAQELAGEHSAAETKILAIESLVLKTMNMIRQMGRGLFPYREGLVNLQGMLLDIAAQAIDLYRVDCTADVVPGAEVTDFTTLRHIYYIIREGVLNAIKHASPNRVSIRAFCEHDTLVISVFNDGHAIHEAPDYRKGLGIRLLKYRARIINGSLEINRKGHEGTELRLMLRR